MRARYVLDAALARGRRAVQQRDTAIWATLRLPWAGIDTHTRLHHLIATSVVPMIYILLACHVRARTGGKLRSLAVTHGQTERPPTWARTG